MEVRVKREALEASGTPDPIRAGDGMVTKRPAAFIEISDSSTSSSGSDSESESEGNGGVSLGGDRGSKRSRKLDDELGAVLPVGFLAPLPPSASAVVVAKPHTASNGGLSLAVQSCKQFWKAGDYEGAPTGDWGLPAGGMDHVRVHPKFLHSNATSHKWALGAFAELLDNSLDEACNGATYANVDMLTSKKDGSRMILIEDNGGGMDPDKMRHCMSLGYSAKSKLANTIGQYGNGFKTSTMRLGADVIVFSRCYRKNQKSHTQSIGLLSYTFLRSTGKEDIVVPMLDYEREGREWNKMLRFSVDDWNRNVETIVQWSPFSSEADLLHQFNLMSDHGTRIIIYNLWEDDEGLSELDFDADPHDIQLRGVNRDEKNIQMAKEFPNSRHFLTYKHSLRSYASILYLRLPPRFRIILRGKDVEQHNIVNDMMLSQEITYRPQAAADGAPKDSNMTAVVTIGFVKDAKHHIDVQGFNVYHKNRLIKPFWRLWNAAGSDGRGVIGVLEANFVEPAHDKQGFERTTVLARLEARLVQMQKNYWSTYCHKIGYAPRKNKKVVAESSDGEISPDHSPHIFSGSKRKHMVMRGKIPSSSSSKGNNSAKKMTISGRRNKTLAPASPAEDDSYDDIQDRFPARQANGSIGKMIRQEKYFEKDGLQTTPSKVSDSADKEHALVEADSSAIAYLQQENNKLKELLEKNGAGALDVRINGLPCERCNLLERQLQEAKQKLDELDKDHESLIAIFSEERERRDMEEENLRKKLKDASNTIQELLDKVRLLEKMKSYNYRAER
uniref:Morc S5 domain-containing protein n=2 Tax=Rhizophora mucronata TaxID=61149 RepID=A0A2P2JUM4_RHIMU